MKGRKEKVLVKSLIARVASIILPWIRIPGRIAIVALVAPSAGVHRLTGVTPSIRPHWCPHSCSVRVWILLQLVGQKFAKNCCSSSSSSWEFGNVPVNVEAVVARVVSVVHLDGKL